MKPLVFLLLLDFSGSMEQALDQRPKIHQLKVEVGALLSTGPAGSSSIAYVFGTRPALACKDIREIDGPTNQVARSLSSLQPGAYGKTPLSAGLMKVVSAATDHRAKQVIIVTDGGDTCGQDPCQTMLKADAELGRRKMKLSLHLVGFDLRGERSKLECFKNLKLNNISLTMSEAGNSLDLQALLKKSQLSDWNEEVDMNQKDLAGIKGAKRFRLRTRGTDSSGSADRDAKNHGDSRGEALLEIVGAPSEAKFLARSATESKDWMGSYVVSLAPGTYELAFSDANGSNLQVTLPVSSHTKIPWARLLKMSTAGVNLKAPKLVLKWKPEQLTEQIHGSLESFETVAELGAGSLAIPPVAFGDWKVEVLSPPWLKGLVKERVIHVNLDGNELDLTELFQAEIEWIKNPNAGQPSVLSLRSGGEAANNFLIPEGQTEVPVVKGTKVEWIKPK